jgi:hypothetical protein
MAKIVDTLKARHIHQGRNVHFWCTPMFWYSQKLAVDRVPSWLLKHSK